MDATQTTPAKPLPETGFLRRFPFFEPVFPTGRIEIGRLTSGVIVLCLLVAIFTDLGADEATTNLFNITEIFRINGTKVCRNGLPEIRAGEVWWLLSPSFVHFSIAHLLNNLFGIAVLGTLIEVRQGAVKLAGWVLLTGVASNLAQYLHTGPGFGGLSGVISGLVSFVWVRHALDPASHLRLHKVLLVCLLLWQAVCLSGVIPHIAWTMHLVGFLVGLAGGTITGLWASKRHHAVRTQAP